MWVIGHRGAPAYALENTLQSIVIAIELGMDAIEIDIQLSKDGEAMVIHDKKLDRTTNGRGFVKDYTAKQLSKFRANNGEKIPTLSDVLDVVDKRCRMFIELKADGSEEPVAEIIDEYIHKHGWSHEQFYVCAFNHLLLDNLHKIDPDIYTCTLFAGIPVTLAQIGTDAHAYAINPNFNSINKELVDDAHKRNMKVFVWTVNRKRDIEHVKSLGVDGIITDRPKRIYGSIDTPIAA